MMCDYRPLSPKEARDLREQDDGAFRHLLSRINDLRRVALFGIPSVFR